MSGDQLRQGIRSFSPLAHVIVIERLDGADFRQTLLPTLHPGMRRRRSCAWSKQEQWSHSLQSVPQATKPTLYSAALKAFQKSAPRSLRSLGKQLRQHIGNEVQQAVTDHVGDQIATPQIKSRQNYSGSKRDKNICCAS